jgi:O-antigen/teichoic acid export membrane protein
MLSHYAGAETRKQGVARPGFIRLSAAAFSTLLGIGSSILIARTLGPDTFGSYTFVLWLATISVPVIGVGLSPVASRYIAEMQRRQEPRMVAGIFRFVWHRQSRGMLVYCAIYLLLALPLSEWFGANAPLLAVLLAGLTALPLLLSTVVGVMLRGLRRFDVLATIHLFSAVSGLFLITLAVQIVGGFCSPCPQTTGGASGQSEQIGVFLLASALAGTFSLAVGVISVMRLLPMRDAAQPHVLVMDRLTRGVSNSLPLFLLDAIVWQRSEILLLGHWQNSAQLGFYSLSAIISAHIMEFSPLALSTCILPLVLRFLPRWCYVNAADAFLKTSLYVALLALPVCLLTIVFCPTIVAFCFGTAYLPVVLPLRLLTVSATVGSIATVSLTHLANGDRRLQIRLGIVAAALNIVLAVPLILLWGITGAALASMIAQLVSAIGSMLICWKLIFR